MGCAAWLSNLPDPPAAGGAVVVTPPPGVGRGEKKPGAGCKYPRRVMIDGKVYRVCGPEEERQLLERFLAKREADALELIQENAPKPRIAAAKVKVVKIARRIDSLEDRADAWLQRLRDEDDEILLTLH